MLKIKSLITIAVIVVFFSACTRAVQIPQSDFATIKSSDAKRWRITTSDDRVYSVKRFYIKKDSLIIEEVFGTWDVNPSIENLEFIDNSDLPYSLAIEDVNKLERIEINAVLTALAISGVVGVAGFIAYVYIMFSALGSLG